MASDTKELKPTIISPRAVARRLHIDVETLRDMAAAGKVPALKVGLRLFRFYLTDITKYISEVARHERSVA